MYLMLNFMWSKYELKWRIYVTLVLSVLTAGLFVSTAVLFVQNIAQRNALQGSIRSAGWVAYQAKLESIKFAMSVEKCAVAQVLCNRGELGLNAAILASRIAVLSDSEEGSQIANIQEFKYDLRTFFAYFSALSDDLLSQSSENISVDTQLQIMRSQSDSVDKLLSEILKSAVLVNKDITIREQLINNKSVELAFLMLSASSIGLVLFMAFEMKRRRRLLSEVFEMRRIAVEHGQELMDLLDAIPVAITLASDNLTTYSNVAFKDLLSNFGCSNEFLLSEIGAALAVDARSTSLSLVVEGVARNISFMSNNVNWLGQSTAIFAIEDRTHAMDYERQSLISARLMLLGELASSIAHELNQPLAVIAAAAENAIGSVASGKLDNEYIKKKLQNIIRQVERADKVTQTILDMARQDRVQTEPFSVIKSLHVSIGFVSHQLRLANVDVEVVIKCQTDCIVVGGPSVVEVALLNILLNARDAFDGMEVQYQKKLRVDLQCTEEVVYIIITDNAGGIKKEILDKVFLPFVTSKESSGGTGLGLAIARRGIRSMGGDINVQNTADGAQFILSLPLKRVFS